jgi:hypothetical protein
MGEERGGWGEDEIEDSLCDYVVDSNDETEVIVMPDEDEPSVQAAREDSSEPERWPPFVDVAKVGSSIGRLRAIDYRNMSENNIQAFIEVLGLR